MRKSCLVAVLATLALLAVTACAPYVTPARSQIEFNGVPEDGCPVGSFEATIAQSTNEAGIFFDACQPAMVARNTGTSEWLVVVIPPEGMTVTVTVNWNEYEISEATSFFVHDGEELTAHIGD